MTDERPSHDQEFVEYVVKSIVDHPDDVQIERSIDEMGVLITLSVNPEDMGQIIGRQGATAKSIRTLLRVIGARNNARVNLKVAEPEGSQQSSESRPKEETTSSEDESSSEDQSKKTSVDEALDDLNI